MRTQGSRLPIFGRDTYVTRPSLPPLPEYVRRLRSIWASRWLTNRGPMVREFERVLTRQLRVPDLCCTTNGTLALQLAYRALFPAGATIVTTPFTYAATVTALIWEGFTPRFADIDPETFNLDPTSVAESLEDSGAGVVGVHVFGNTSGARELDALARKHSLPLVFDAAHAFGVEGTVPSHWKLGDASTLSFHATKNFHTFEGGAVLSRHARTVGHVRRLGNFGMSRPDEPLEAGINAKMTEPQAAMGLLNLRYVRRWIAARRRRYLLYRRSLALEERVQFQRVALAGYNFPYVPVLLPSRRERERVYARLLREHIQARRYFYPPLHRLPFLPRKRRQPCPAAESVSNRVLTLPLYPDLPLSEIHRVVRIVREVLR